MAQHSVTSNMQGCTIDIIDYVNGIGNCSREQIHVYGTHLRTPRYGLHLREQLRTP